MLDLLQKIEILRDNPLFRSLHTRELIRLAKITSELEFGAGTLVINEGDAGDELFIIVEGDVEVFTGTRSVSTLGPGSCIGELSVIDTEPRSSSVRTLSASRLLSMKRKDFLLAIKEEPAIAVNIMKILADRLRYHLGK